MTSPLNVLLIEDSEVDREIICSLFGEFDEAPRVSVASTASEGLEALRSRSYDCALIDYRLPDGDAVGVLETLGRESRPLPPALVVTGMGTERIAAQAFKHGARDYLRKDGLTSKVLREAVQNAVEAHRCEQLDRRRGLIVPEDFEELFQQVIRATGDELLPPVRRVNELARDLHGLMRGASPEQSDLMEALREQAHHSNRLIRDLQRFVRVQACERLICRVDPADAVSLACFAYQDDLSDERGKIEIEPLPFVMISPHLLVEVFRQLLDNSVKFRGSESLRVRISGETREGMATLRVEDNGIGIPPEDAERVFGLFQRLDRDEAYAGTGMGLALVRRIVKLHGGAIWCDPAPQGACIRFTLPAG